MTENITDLSSTPFAVGSSLAKYSQKSFENNISFIIDFILIVCHYSLFQEDSPFPNTARQVHNLSTFPHPDASGVPFCYI